MAFATINKPRSTPPQSNNRYIRPSDQVQIKVRTCRSVFRSREPSRGYTSTPASRALLSFIVFQSVDAGFVGLKQARIKVSRVSLFSIRQTVRITRSQWTRSQEWWTPKKNHVCAGKMHDDRQDQRTEPPASLDPALPIISYLLLDDDRQTPPPRKK